MTIPYDEISELTDPKGHKFSQIELPPPGHTLVECYCNICRQAWKARWDGRHWVFEEIMLPVENRMLGKDDLPDIFGGN